MSDAKIFVAPFVGGLNTEQSSVTDLPTYTSDELNCTIYPEGIRGRRYGMSVERDGMVHASGVEGTPRTFQGYFWKNVAKTSQDFAVYLVDTTLHFYDASTKPFSIAKIDTTLDISEYVTDVMQYYNYPVKFVSGAGTLMMVSKFLVPIQISYDFATTKFNIEKIELKVRDIDGVDDGLKIDAMPSELSDYHNYNLQNQGWSLTEINKFYSDKKQYPANNLQWFVGKDNSGNYNTEELLKHYFGNTPAPKGHFILDYFDKNRAKASGIYGGAARKATWAYARCWVSSRSYCANIIREYTQEIPNSAGTATAATLQLQRLACKVWKRSWGPWNGNVDIKIEGYNKSKGWVKVNEIRHYFYGTESGGNKNAEIFNMSWDNSTAYDKYRFHVKFLGEEKGSYDANLYAWPCMVTANMQLSIAEDGDPFAEERSTSTNRVTDVAYMAGKFFYLVNDTVLFSQTVTDENKGYDLCYQSADPTSEEISDIVPTDGGYVKFQTMGDGMALKTFNRGVLVFGRDVVYGLISPSDGRFTATEYDTVELSKAGLIGPQSVVSIADSVYYWSPLGIFKVGVNQQTGSTMVAENISQLTIQSFYNNIPQFAKENCRAAFDYCNNRIYWFYPLDSEDTTKLNGVLMYDLNYKAFIPMKIADGGKVTAVFETLNSYEVAPTIYLRAGGQRVIAGDNYITTIEENVKYNRFVAICHCMLTDEGISFGDFNSREYTDWDAVSYDSYMVSRPITIEAISRYGKQISGTYDDKQVPILQTLFKRTEEGRLKDPKKYIAQSGAFLRMRWGWSLNSNSNRWDMVQNAYRPQKDFMNDEYVESRIHLRGRGKAYQIEIRNDGNKDFRLAGMNMLVRTQ